MDGQSGAIAACAPATEKLLLPLFSPASICRPPTPVHPAISSKQRKMNSKRACYFSNLTDDLVVEILSRLPFKSFTRSKCVCKAWLNFSADPYYSQKLPKIPSGFFYQDQGDSVIQFISLSSKDEGIDETLSFLPQHAHLNFVDCSSGLVLCEYRSNSTSPDIFCFIVCNPATREWRVLPDIQRDLDKYHYRTMLAFDPSKSPHFYVFHFPHEHSPDGVRGISHVEMFSSLRWTWLEDGYLWDPENDGIVVSERPHVFLDRTLYVRTSEHDFLVLEKLETVTIGMPPSRWTVKSPLQRFESVVDHYGCLGQVSGILHYAAPEKDGCTIVVWSNNDRVVYDPDKWIVKYRLSMRDAFGRADFVHYDDDAWEWFCDYKIVAVDLEREVLFLFDYKAEKLLLYSIGTGELTSIKDGHQMFKYYVATQSFQTQILIFEGAAFIRHWDKAP